MAEHWTERVFEKEEAEQEVFAQSRGYTIKDAASGSHYVFKQTSALPLALCVSRWDAVRIAYALAKAFPVEA